MTTYKSATLGTVTIPENNKIYFIATVNDGDGSFHLYEEFEASDDHVANAYAEEWYPNLDWYVLDAEKNNING